MRDSLLRTAAFLCMCVFLLGNAHVSFADDLTYTEAYFTRQEGYSGIVEVRKDLAEAQAKKDTLAEAAKAILA